ncbi:MAG: CRISPR-associated helicase Cas3' [Sedimenticola sp.]
MTYFWAKTTPDGNPGISIYDHMVNVGYVARCIAEISPELLERFHLESALVGALAALHDLGKISPGFQRKCKAWLNENSLTEIEHNGCWDTAMESNHGKVSHAAIQSFLTKQGSDRKTSKYVSAVLGAHHGYLSRPKDSGYRPEKATAEPYSNIDWDSERITNARMIWNQFLEVNIPFSILEESPSLWWLAGLTTVADWIGSNEHYFLPDQQADKNDPSSIARHALDAIGFRKPAFVHSLSFHNLFHDTDKPDNRWTPNDMQEKAIVTIRGPGVYVIEAPMGMGKTEAALWAAYQLLVSGKASGIYFALPTQATSNRIHVRMNEFLRRITSEADTSRLIHGNSWLMDCDYCISPTSTEAKGKAADDARLGRDWFSSTKRALLAPFGVGTVDQALLGVVAAKHFFVRHFALAGKVVILDEVHSYDIYTGTLIDKLITTLEGLGCTVIVLSATLTGKRRGKIISLQGDTDGDAKLPYPLITGRTEGELLDPAAATPPESKKIVVDFVSTEKGAEEAIELARNGGAVIWICNTVYAAQDQYKHFTNQVQDEFPIGLLHSRFPFWRREKLEDEWMARFGKDGATRCGSILVSTQIVEQSVDLDADLLITELAPTDMLLQRLGRLWRHDRQGRPSSSPRLCIIDETKSLDELRIMKPKAIVKVFGGKASVYAPYALLRSLEVWKALNTTSGRVEIPSQIRPLIESTYETIEKEPETWTELSDKWFGTDSARKMEANRNCNLWQVALEDAEGVQTRLNEVPTIALVLCRTLTGNEAIFIDQTKGIFGDDQYRLSTAQSIHKNLVKVPDYCFARIEIFEAFSDYLFGSQCAGIVSEDGSIEVKGLKDGIKLNYSDKFGLVINKSSAKEKT